MMKAMVLEAFGGVEHFHMRCWPLPVPGPGQVRIRIQAISLNPVDYKMRQGRLYGDLPAVLGRDAAGTVDAVGPDVTGFREGDSVLAVLFGPSSNGAYAQYAATDAAFVSPLPVGTAAGVPCDIPVTVAVTMGVAGLTAYEVVVRKARVTAGEAVFVAGGSGGVGSYVIPLLRVLGAEPILATAGSDASAAYLTRVLGVRPEHILRYPELSAQAQADWVRAESGGRGVAAAFDLVGGDMKRLCFQVIDFYGRVVSCVEEYDPDFAIDIWHPQISPLYARSGSYHYVAVSAPARFGGPRDWAVYGEMSTALRELVQSGRLPLPPVTELGELDEQTIRRAHTLLETGHVQGKLVLTVG